MHYLRRGGGGDGDGVSAVTRGAADRARGDGREFISAMDGRRSFTRLLMFWV